MRYILLGFALAICFSCHQKMTDKIAIAKPNIAVYQLKNMGSLALVPVKLDSAKQNIVSYPSPSDLSKMKSAEVYQNWVIDQRGINPNTVFVNMSIQDYITQNKLPDLAVWQDLIDEKNPFKTFYQCPGTLNLSEIKEMIAKKRMKKCNCLIS